MRQNLPVTGTEHPFLRGKILVSKTNPKGQITYANDAFVELSGFTREELIGQPHNIVRHPDMPPQAFADMWRTLKEGYPWRGLVKNRRKTGDHYWVDALAVPIRKNGEPAGYMSVRTEPTREEVRAAEALYGTLRAGKAKFSTRRSGLPSLSLRTVAAAVLGGLCALLVLLAFASRLGLPSWLDWLWLAMGVGGAGLFYAYLSHRVAARLSGVVDTFNRIAEGQLANRIDIRDRDEVGRVLAALAAMQVQLRVVVDEIRVAEQGVAREATEMDGEVAKLALRAQSQQDGVLRVTAAMEEVSVSVSEVAHGASQASEATRTARGLVDEGHAQMESSIRSSGRLVEAVDTSVATMNELSEAIRQIGNITGVIKDVADQTNLLALNAAIEAARAGEQGRGFSVVADEVRKLAERTATSTADIVRMVEQIQHTTERAVGSMHQAAGEVAQGRNQLEATEKSFTGIVSSSDSVLDMARHIADATKEQSVASEDVAKHMEQISGMIEENARSVETVRTAASRLAKTSGELHGIVAFFGS
ncbi:MAG: methyl-accepting chemotaxis protein [Rhodocyclales bacterium]|nr:methyl-accepting chemotaxis protein [Rhodocyclales bacterium]